MNDRMLQKQIDTIKGGDVSQDTDISALKAAVGTVPTGEGNDLQSQITAINTAIGEVPTGEGNDLQSQITALAVRVKTLEDAANGAGSGSD